MFYRIYSSGGADHGSFPGRSPAAALAAMHRDAGYAVRVRRGQLVFGNPSDAEACGTLDAWQVIEDRDYIADRRSYTASGRRDPWSGGWQIMRWDAGRQIWDEGPTYRTLAQARKALRVAE